MSAGKSVVIVFADLVIFLELLDDIDAVAANVTHGDFRGFGIFVRELDQFLAALLVEFGDAQAQCTCPSVAGDRPRLALTIAFSTACTSDLSQTLTAIKRGSGMLTVAS